ncbi:hypothetical protein PSACC_00136 [Paramicrosporidium saccamoebae]|uniref:Uncharacterized protein n=1 Tax=Paramicrosporidium saccamoebae TaxID=1246581 RepID=A0A2H9TQM5_9FUNG|nr:hypothetical protein PSACC_00136 [Paramicrosporidium saccamoebae]
MCVLLGSRQLEPPIYKLCFQTAHVVDLEHHLSRYPTARRNQGIFDSGIDPGNDCNGAMHVAALGLPSWPSENTSLSCRSGAGNPYLGPVQSRLPFLAAFVLICHVLLCMHQS